MHLRRGGENAGNGTLRGFYFWGWRCTFRGSRRSWQGSSWLSALPPRASCRRRPSPRPIRTKSCASRFPAAEAGFDPVRISDLYSATVLEGIFERLLTYDYLARPAKVVPMLAESMPAVTDNGKTYTFKLRKGVYFAPDPIWKGAKRELVAQDVVYSYMRFLDPKNRRAVRVSSRRQDRGARRARGEREEEREIRLRRQDPRHRGRRPLHGALPAQGNRLQLPLHRRAHLARHRCARGDRGLRRGHDGASGGHGSLHAHEPGRAARRSCSSRIRNIAASSGTSLRRIPRPGTTSSSRTCAASRCRRSAASRSRSSRRRSRAGSRSSRSSSITSTCRIPSRRRCSMATG